MKIPTRKWSHSAYQQYVDCGEAFRLQRIERVPSRPNISMVGGEAFHRWTDEYDRHMLGFRFHPPREYADILKEVTEEREERSGIPRQEWRQLGQWSFATYLKHGPEWCSLYHQWQMATDWVIAGSLPPDTEGNCVGIEYALEYECGTVTMRGYVDRVWYTPQGLVVTDTKTWGNPRPAIQNIGYMLGLQSKGVNIVGTAYYEARKGDMTPINEWPTWSMDRLTTMYEQAAWQEAQGFYIPRPTGDCFTCPVQDSCQFRI